MASETHIDVPQPDRRLDLWERRLSWMASAAPYALLAAATILALMERRESIADRLITLALAALTAGWMLWMITLHPAWERRRGLMGLYCAGLLALIGLLIARHPWFGLFAFTGYMHSWHLLHGGWRLLGVAATASLTATWQFGGLPEPTVPGIASYLVFVGLIVTLVAIFSSVGQVTAEQSAQRKLIIAELADTNRRLEATLAENAGLHAQVLTQAREAGMLDERQRMAREIHDTLAQNLAGIVRQLEAAEQVQADPEQWRRYLDQARALARQSLADARRSVQALRPATLESVALPEAIADMARRWAESSAVALTVETTGQPQPLLPEIETALFRCAQEALANVARHAQASRVGLTLSYMDDVVLLDVRDDGIGFDADSVVQTADHGFGLRSMEQRLRRVAGTLAIETGPGEGTAISACVPAIAAGDV